jgi:hypothetical protein
MYVLVKKTKSKKSDFLHLIKPVPSNVIANETDERPLINVSTANGARRPILKMISQSFSIPSFTYL